MFHDDRTPRSNQCLVTSRTEIVVAIIFSEKLDQIKSFLNNFEENPVKLRK